VLEDNKSRGPSGSSELEQRLASFRERFPVDDRAFDFLEKSPTAVLTKVLTEFRPQQEGQPKYSALLTHFVRQVRNRIERRERQDPRQGSGTHRRRRRQPVSHSHKRHSHSAIRGCDQGAPQAEGSGAAIMRQPSVSSKGSAKMHCDNHSRSSSLSSLGGSQDCSSEASFTGASRLSTSHSHSSSRMSSTSRSRSSIGSSAGVSEGCAKTVEEKMASIISGAKEDERHKIAEAEADARRAVEERVAQAEEEADQEMKAKLAEYQQILQSQRQDKIEHVVRAADIAAKEHIKRAHVEAEQERIRKVQMAKTDIEVALQEAREQREKHRQQRHRERGDKAKKRKEELDKQRRLKPHRGKLRRVSLKKVIRHDKKRRRRRRRRDPKERTMHGDSRSPSCSAVPPGLRSRSRRNRQRSDRDPLAEDRRRPRSRSRNGAAASADRQAQDRSPTEAELRSFRDRYPMDDRAFLALTQAPSSVRRDAITQFKPRREGEDDYSALVASFLRSLLARQDRAARPPLRQRRWRDRRETRENGAERESSPLSAFRTRYPMDSRAFAALSRAPTNVRAVVVSDFKPRREGEDDYSALVMSFVRAVQSRVGMGKENESNERPRGDKDEDKLSRRDD